MKKKLSLLLVLCLVLSALAFTACGGGGNEETPKTPEQMLIEGHYVFGYSAPGNSTDNTTGFFRFYEEKPTVGKVFYAYLAGKAFGGTYKLEEKEYSYSVYTNRDDAVADNGESDSRQVKAKASHTITYYNFDGVLVDEAGFDGEYLYHDAAADSALYMTGMAPVRYTHDTDANSTYKTIYGKETIIAAPVISLIADDDKTSTLDIYHNNTYIDLIGNKIEGTWTVTKDEDNKLTYTLTPKLASKTGGVLVVAADKKTATFTPTGGTAVAMTRDIYYVSVVAELTGITYYVHEGDDGPVNIPLTHTLSLYDDGTAKLVSVAFGQSSTVDTATWEKKVGKVEIIFNAAGTVDATISGEEVTLDYATDALTVTLTGDASGFEAAIAYEVTGNGKVTHGQEFDATFELYFYDDGTCELYATAFNNRDISDAGTWVAEAAWGGAPKTITFDAAGEVVGAMDMGTITYTYSHSGTTATLILRLLG